MICHRLSLACVRQESKFLPLFYCDSFSLRARERQVVTKWAIIDGKMLARLRRLARISKGIRLTRQSAEIGFVCICPSLERLPSDLKVDKSHGGAEAALRPDG